jgi:hypothetical protein
VLKELRVRVTADTQLALDELPIRWQQLDITLRQLGEEMIYVQGASK